MQLNYQFHQKTLQDIDDLYRNGRLILTPGFQRKSVWKLSDRRKLIESILRNYPVPAIFLYKRIDGNSLVYDVIDGKQRLETVLYFMGCVKGKKFSLQTDALTEADSPVDWLVLGKLGKQADFKGYKIPVVEVEGDLADIINLFVRINSTGKPLTKPEQQHAKYFNNDLLKKASALANKYETYFLDNGIVSKSQIDRMKHVELTCELLLSAHTGNVINKKIALEKAMAANAITAAALKKASIKTVASLNTAKRIFTDLYSTRFSKLSDFYSLVVLLQKYEDANLILTDKKSNRLANDLLTAFGTGVDQVSELLRKGKPVPDRLVLHRDYLFTVREGSDQEAKRRQREVYLNGLLRSLFERKDSLRLFTKEQRRIIWNSSAERKCAQVGCSVRLTWSDFTIDHINPHSKGGQTKLENAALMCRKHNSKKGNKLPKVAFV